jgi:Family of unknown function (DUF6153)
MTGRLRVTGRFGMPRWATIGLLGILLIGVFAMHGLASHHVTDVGHGEIGATASIPDMSSPAGMSEADPCEAAVCQKGDHEASTVLLTLCIAVLVGIAVLLVGALAATRRSAVPRRTCIRHRIRPVPLGGPDPPNLHQLSLLRC